MSNEPEVNVQKAVPTLWIAVCVGALVVAGLLGFLAASAFASEETVSTPVESPELCDVVRKLGVDDGLTFTKEYERSELRWFARTLEKAASGSNAETLTEVAAVYEGLAARSEEQDLSQADLFFEMTAQELQDLFPGTLNEDFFELIEVCF